MPKKRLLNEVSFKDDIAFLKIKDGTCFLVDEEDYEKIKNYTWRENQHGYIETSYKIPKTRNTKRIFLHRLIMGTHGKDWKKTLTDHISGDKKDNRKSNLRLCTNTENQINRKRRKDNTHGYPGVFLDKRCNTWFATISVNGKRKYIGGCKNREEATKKRKEAEEKHYAGIKKCKQTSRMEVLDVQIRSNKITTR